jgi:VIT1/CCC1 family predicted Fe2+/Mn2+ transporter
MVIDELGVAEIDQKRELKGTIFIFISFILGALFPVLPYIIFQFLPPGYKIMIFLIAAVETFVGLFLVGALKKFITGVNWLKSGLEMLLVGTLAFIASFFIGGFIESLV